MGWKLINASAHTNNMRQLFWTNLPRKTQLCKIGATVRVIFIMQKIKYEFNLDA